MNNIYYICLQELSIKPPHYQDRRQHAAGDFLAGWKAAERWRTDKENIPDGELVMAVYAGVPCYLDGITAKANDLVIYWKPLPKLPEE